MTGTVTSATDGLALPGVNITVEGSEALAGGVIGTNTNAAGEFTINVPQGSNTLVFSLIGYEPSTVNIDGRTEIDVALETRVLLLDAVVAVGYGTQTQRDATGSVGSIGEADFNRGVISSPEQLLQGRMAGVQITTASGEPGAGANIRIRGTSSVRSGNEPLFVVDGVPLSGSDVTPGGRNFGAGTQSPRNPLAFLNPADIESVSVLKDASAAAIYGSRGSNGVVLITTKSGMGQGPTMTVSSSTSISTLPTKLDLLSAGEYVAMGEAAGADPSVINFNGATDWQDEIFRSAVSQNTYVSYGDGTANGSYRLSLGYDDQEGIVGSSSLERLTGRINANQSLLNDRLTLDLSLTATRLRDRHVPVGNTAGFQGDLIGAALQANPTRPVYDEDGDYFQSSDFRNPVAMLDFVDDKSETGRILGNVSGSLEMTNWLTYRANLGYDNSDAVRRTGISARLDFPDTRDTNGRAVIENRHVNTLLVEHTLDARGIRFGPEGAVLGALAGFSYQRFENRGDFLQAEHFVTDEIPPVDNIGGVNNDDFKAFLADSDRNVDELQSYFARANYNYRDRYLVTANFRADGSTKFGRNNKYGYFPSVALAWNLSNEDFFSRLSSGFASSITDLKLRGGYGVTGNQEFPSGVALAIFETNDDGSLTQTNNPNPDIQWEETAQWGLGLDFELLDGRLGGSVDYFNKQTKNLIFRRDFAQPAAVDFQWVNLDGVVENTGWELALSALPVNNSTLSWGVDYNVSFVDNAVKNLDTFVNTGQIHGQGLSGAYAQRIAEGQPLYSFYMREFEGFDEEGLGVYANNEELAFVGDPLPDLTMGLTNTLTLGRLDVSAFLEGAFGFQVYNNTANAIFLKGNLRNGRNVTKDIASGSESSDNFGEASTRFLEDGDYVRLSNLNVGYNLDMSRWSNAIRSLRIGVTGQNLFLITDYSGFDPEVNTDKSIDGIPSLGIDYTAYPRPRTFTFSVTAEF